MNNMKIKFTYALGGALHTDSLADGSCYSLDCAVGEKSVKGSIKAKTKLTMQRIDLIFEHEFKKGDNFFSNGYQSWSTSREYTKAGKMQDITPIAFAKPLKNLAGISADCRFVSVPENAGEFYSHAYTYIRNGADVFFMGSLTERQGFTVFYADMNKNTLTISKDVEGVTLEVGEEYALFDIFITEGSYDEVFDAYFNAMGIKKPRIEHMSGYTSWYNYFQKIDENIILRDLNSLDCVKDSVSIFQIDDGYETFVGDWMDLNAKKFPHGMGHIAEKIHDKGYMAGIWLAPFNVQIRSKTFKNHPDWVIRDAHNRPVLGCVGWGGAFTLDIYNTDARNYIRSFFTKVLDEWGYDMVKLDFLYSQCMYPRNNKSRGTIMVEAMEFLRECCGDKLILGCGVPLGAAFGYVDACRIGCDVDLKYTGKFYNALGVNNEIPSAKNSINNAVFRRHLDGRAFCSDPDVFFLRYSNLEFDIPQKILLAGINHLFGDVLFVSDNAAEYKPEDIELIKKAFEKSDIKVISAERVTENKVVIELVKDGKAQTLYFDFNTGFSNMAELLGVSEER